MPPKLITPAIVILGLLSAYYLYQTANALYTGVIVADKRYHHAEVFRSEDPFMFFQTLGFQIIGFLAPAWITIVLFRQRRSKTS